jgi:GTP cyclohydrolase II
MMHLSEVARVRLPTTAGQFDARAFQVGGSVYLALVRGEIGDGRSLLTRLHSECLTGEALGSLRCDCGPQLQLTLRALAAEGRGVLVYAIGHEGRGIGLVNKLRAYREQDAGADTMDANLRLGLPADGRDYAEAAAVLAALGARSVRLLTNNPRKAEAMRAAGIEVERLEGLVTAPNLHNHRYLETKRERMGHIDPLGPLLPELYEQPVDVTPLLGHARPRPERPFVLLKYAQTLDGRIATRGGDARWISGAAERRISHALRAACDAVLVGSGTVLRDDPLLTVRLVPGVSPLRIVLDSRLRTPLDAKVLNRDAPTLVITTERAGTRDKRRALAEHNVGVGVVAAARRGVDLHAMFRRLRADGVRSVMVEGGARVITSMLAAGVVDRLVAGVAPRIIGAGTEAVQNLTIDRVADAIPLVNRTVHPVEEDVLFAFDVLPGGNGRADVEPPLQMEPPPTTTPGRRATRKP